MAYLLAKFTLIFLLAAILSFILGYWWARRQFVDVTESFTKLTSTDMTSVNQRLDAIGAGVSNIRIPEPTPAPDLSGINARLAAVEESVSNIRIPEPTATTDLSGVTTRLDAVDNAVKAIRIPQSQSVDLSPVISRLESVDSAVNSIRMPDAPRTDLSGVEGRLDSIEAAIDKIKVPAAAPAPKPKKEGPVLLKKASFGKPDNLKEISGVGPKLERLLHQNGVYYFWQVAEWSRRDIDIVDAKLEVFKGRIARDNWVTQAKKLAKAPGSAARP